MSQLGGIPPKTILRLAIAQLKALPREKDNDFAFIGRISDGLSGMALLMLLRRMERTGITTHGFRSTFRVWVAECTHLPRDLAEAALAHVNGDKVEAAYQRSDRLERRRAMMQVWAGFCGQPYDASNIVPFKATAKIA